MRKPIFIASVTALAVVAVFYSTTRWQARETVSDFRLAPASLNSLQHSLGAAELYALTSTTGLRPRILGAGIEVLGHVNEWVEHSFKRNKDSTEEVYKDLRNNLVGLTAAKWINERFGWRFSMRQRRAVIAVLADSHELAYASDDPLVPRFGTGNATGPAMARYRADRKSIAGRTRSFLEANAEIIAKKADSGS